MNYSIRQLFISTKTNHSTNSINPQRNVLGEQSIDKHGISTVIVIRSLEQSDRGACFDVLVDVELLLLGTQRRVVVHIFHVNSNCRRELVLLVSARYQLPIDCLQYETFNKSFL